MYKRLRGVLGVSCLIFVILAGDVSRGQTQQAITTREISLSLKRQESNRRKSVTTRTVQLGTHKTATTEGDTIRSLLERGGVSYDGSSLSLVYDLNPTLENAGTIKKGSEIVLPMAVGGTGFQKSRAHGYLLTIDLDRRLKKALLDNHTRLDALSRELSKPNFNRNDESGNVAIRAAVKETLESLQVIKKAIQENVQPFSHDSLSQLTDETDLMIEILVGIVSNGKPITASDRAAIVKIKDDVSVKVESLSDSKGPGQTPDRQKDVRVIVKTLRNGQTVSSVRIYYIGEALFGNTKYQAKSFTTIDNPSEKNINEGDYMVWAGNAVDSSKLSQPVLVNVRKSQVTNGSFGLALYLDLAVR